MPGWAAAGCWTASRGSPARTKRFQTGTRPSVKASRTAFCHGSSWATTSDSSGVWTLVMPCSSRREANGSLV